MIREIRRDDNMGKLLIPEGYTPVIDYMESQRAIKKIKDFLSAGAGVRPEAQKSIRAAVCGSGNGTERQPQRRREDGQLYREGYGTKRTVEIVQSLAKWKRMALGRYGFEPGRGLYTDMNAIRRDEELDNLHSVYVDQWDWEKVINKGGAERTKYLEETVTALYNALKNLNDYVNRLYTDLATDLPNEIFFITSQELERHVPGQNA